MNNKDFRQMCDLEREVRSLKRALSIIAGHADKALDAANINQTYAVKASLLLINVAITAVDPALLPKKITWKNIT